MTEAAVARTTQPNSTDAGAELGQRVLATLGGKPPDALIVFASSRYDYGALLTAIEHSCQPAVVVGCSSAGEFTSGSQGEGSACVVALRAPEMRFTAGLGRGIGDDRQEAARDIVASFRGLGSSEYPYRYALVLSDMLAGYTDQLIEHLTRETRGFHQLFGGGAGDDARFQKTHVFLGTNAYTDAAVALEILSPKPIGIGVGHGWQPASPRLRVTETDGTRLVSLNAEPAMELLQDHARKTNQTLDESQPLPFFLHNVIGVETGAGHKIRVPLAALPDGSVACASDIPENATVRVMGMTNQSAVDAAARATREAVRQLGEHRPRVALFFDCVATRLRLGGEFGFELQAVQDALGSAIFAGCNSYGQIARVEGQFSGFHNCTAVVAVLPE